MRLGVLIAVSLAVAGLDAAVAGARGAPAGSTPFEVAFTGELYVNANDNGSTNLSECNGVGAVTDFATTLKVHVAWKTVYKVNIPSRAANAPGPLVDAKSTVVDDPHYSYTGYFSVETQGGNGPCVKQTFNCSGRLGTPSDTIDGGVAVQPLAHPRGRWAARFLMFPFGPLGERTCPNSDGASTGNGTTWPDPSTLGEDLALTANSRHPGYAESGRASVGATATDELDFDHNANCSAGSTNPEDHCHVSYNGDGKLVIKQLAG